MTRNSKVNYKKHVSILLNPIGIHRQCEVIYDTGTAAYKVDWMNVHMTVSHSDDGFAVPSETTYYNPLYGVLIAPPQELDGACHTMKKDKCKWF